MGNFAHLFVYLFFLKKNCTHDKKPLFSFCKIAEIVFILGLLGIFTRTSKNENGMEQLTPYQAVTKNNI